MSATTATTRAGRRWTDDDERQLAWLWEQYDLREVAKRLGRTPIAVYFRLHYLGLGNGFPRGGESLQQAADRAGVSHRHLRRILEWAGVRMRLSRYNPHFRGASRRRRVRWVMPEDVDQAIAAWCRLETITAAADRLGMSRFALDRILAERGQRVPFGRRLLVAPEHADAAYLTGSWRAHARGARASHEGASA